jgi:hypothetical protein
VAGESWRRRDWRGSGLTLAAYVVVGGLAWLLLPDRFGGSVVGGIALAGVLHSLFVLFFQDPPRSGRRL